MPELGLINFSNFQTKPEDLPNKHPVDLLKIDQRLAVINNAKVLSEEQKRTNSLVTSLSTFLNNLPHKPTLQNCNPQDLKRFLVWKDTFGKTKVHDISCFNLAVEEPTTPCLCPKRLSWGYVESLVGRIKKILDDLGRRQSWSETTNEGNPTSSEDIIFYTKYAKEEQAMSHVIRKQAKPMFSRKFKKLCMYIVREAERSDLPFRQRFALMRDQAFFKVLMWGGDRASDLCSLKAQELKPIQGSPDLLACRGFGKTLRNGSVNTYVLPKSQDPSVCPVTALNEYVSWARKWGIAIQPGFLFRKVLDNGVVLDEPINYDIIYTRLKTHLTTLGIDQGETPHSFRAGCTVAMANSGLFSTDDLMSHIGWRSQEMPHYYARLQQLKEACGMSARLESAIMPAINDPQPLFTTHAHPEQRPSTFGLM